MTGDAEVRPDPLTYPGTPHARDGVLLPDRFVDVEQAQVSDLLRTFDAVPLTARTPVAAVGSNAAVDTLRRKLSTAGSSLVLPLTSVTVHGVVPGVSAHVSRPGFVPATPIDVPDEVSQLVVAWLDEPQMAAMDATEPNYYRAALPDRFPVIDGSGSEIACSVYASRHGCLVDVVTGELRRLTDQRTLLRDLLEESAELRTLAGRTPEQFVVSMQDPTKREQACVIFREEGRVHRPDIGRSVHPAPA